MSAELQPKRLTVFSKPPIGERRTQVLICQTKCVIIGEVMMVDAQPHFCIRRDLSGNVPMCMSEAFVPVVILRCEGRLNDAKIGSVHPSGQFGHLICILVRKIAGIHNVLALVTYAKGGVSARMAQFETFDRGVANILHGHL